MENSLELNSEIKLNSANQKEASNQKDTPINTENINKQKTTLSSQHLLNSEWIFWYISRKEKDFDVPYEERLKKIASFKTLEEFFKYYVYLKSASEVDRNSDLSLFKKGNKPLW